LRGPILSSALGDIRRNGRRGATELIAQSRRVCRTQTLRERVHSRRHVEGSVPHLEIRGVLHAEPCHVPVIETSPRRVVSLAPGTLRPSVESAVWGHCSLRDQAPQTAGTTDDRHLPPVVPALCGSWSLRRQAAQAAGTTDDRHLRPVVPALCCSWILRLQAPQTAGTTGRRHLPPVVPALCGSWSLRRQALQTAGTTDDRHHRLQAPQAAGTTADRHLRPVVPALCCSWILRLQAPQTAGTTDDRHLPGCNRSPLLTRPRTSSPRTRSE
jgi:hypothetical protein